MPRRFAGIISSGDDDPPALSALVYRHVSIFGVRSSFKGNVVFRLFQV